jgi:hypothetical protein
VREAEQQYERGRSVSRTGVRGVLFFGPVSPPVTSHVRAGSFVQFAA